MITTTATILLVEDDPEQALLFGQALRRAGYTVVNAATAEEALAKLASDAVTLLLVDWDLPGMNGDELITRVKGRFPILRTVLFSNHAHVDQAARASGADAWVRKIEGVNHLLGIIRAQLPP